jgi:hypothetical protein
LRKVFRCSVLVFSLALVLYPIAVFASTNNDNQSVQTPPSDSKNDTKKDEVKKEEPKKDETKKDEVKKEDPKKEEPKKEEPKKEEIGKDEKFFTVTNDTQNARTVIFTYKQGCKRKKVEKVIEAHATVKIKYINKAKRKFIQVKNYKKHKVQTGDIVKISGLLDKLA